MQNGKYNAILYLIASVIVITLAIQVYWNYKNYEAGKQQLKNEMQISLDAALDNYYVDLADRNTVGFGFKGNSAENKGKIDSLLKIIDEFQSNGIKGFGGIKKDMKEIKVYSGSKIADIDSFFKQTYKPKNGKKTTLTDFFSESATDSINNLAKLTSKVIVSITTDTLDLQRLNGYINEQLEQKGLGLDYGYIFKNNSGDTQKFNSPLATSRSASTQSKSAYLPKKSIFRLYYNDDTFIILKRNLVGILLSALLIAAVIACLFFLLRTINRQKQLAELKNDLISNITHEFKTPIATINVALEGITNFNTENDPVKTRNYVKTSNFQLGKLNTMVEKLLETATLDGNVLNLNKEEVNFSEIMETLVKKHQSLAPQKDFKIQNGLGNAILFADAFHLENAFNNIIDNAVKYGGNRIQVNLKTTDRAYLVSVQDDGNTLTTAQAQQIFEKFYRVPKGNTHDVKGFGIGLYYTKKIIERHGGAISVKTNGKTTFNITLPHG